MDSGIKGSGSEPKLAKTASLGLGVADSNAGGSKAADFNMGGSGSVGRSLASSNGIGSSTAGSLSIEVVSLAIPSSIPINARRGQDKEQ